MADGSHQPDDGLLQSAPRPNPRGAVQKGLLALLFLFGRLGRILESLGSRGSLAAGLSHLLAAASSNALPLGIDVGVKTRSSLRHDEGCVVRSRLKGPYMC